MTKDTEKAELSHTLFVSVFTSKAEVKKSQVPETHEKVWSNENLPMVEDD